jgi:hypothetical protein
MPSTWPRPTCMHSSIAGCTRNSRIDKMKSPPPRLHVYTVRAPRAQRGRARAGTVDGHKTSIALRSTMAAYSPNDVVQAVVADLGQGQTKVGWAGEDYPKSYFRSVRKNIVNSCCLAFVAPHHAHLFLTTIECGSLERTRE